jgi:trehalose 6-phosphate synthase
LKTIGLQLRFLLPLAAVLVVTAYMAVPLVDQVTLRWFGRDLNTRGQLLANAMSDSVGEAVATQRPARLQPLLERAAQDERLYALGLCSADGRLLQSTVRFPPDLSCAKAVELAEQAQPRLALAGGPVHVGVQPVMSSPVRAPPAVEPITEPAAARQASVAAAASEVARADRDTPNEPFLAARLVLLHDLSFIDRRSQDTRRYLIGLIAGLGLVMALITMIVAQLSWRGWVNGMRAILRGEGLVRPLSGDGNGLSSSISMPVPELGPIAAELRARLRDLEDEYRRAQSHDAGWTADRLRQLLRTQLSGDQVIVVSNREPYIHERAEDGSIVVKRPASGLVTAVEPVMRACSGTWVAHGSGSADRDVVDGNDRVAVPPGHQDYFLRRLWLTEQEEQGYYFGFANEGLWPLCHVAHVRPVFRESDWEAYRAVNQRFADAVVAEARSDDPVVLVQDYHFALLPAMIKAKLPQATILTFWHIPWPNPESFGICPWRRELLMGMLGSTILGFHTRYHCKNFIETVDRYLEARIEHEHSTIISGGVETLVESYPISIEWPDTATTAAWRPVPECRAPPHRSVATAPRRLHRRRCRPLRLHQRHPRAHQRSGAAAGKVAALDRPLRLRPGGCTDAFFARGVPRFPGTHPAHHRACQPAFRPRRLSSRAPAGAASRHGSGDRALPGRGHLPRHQPARRDEPRQQGVRCGARRPAGGAHPEPLRRRRARTARSADRQPLPRRRNSRRAEPRCDDAGG